MVLSTVEDLSAVAEAVGTAVDSKTRGFQAVDITFYDKDPSEEDAKEIEPLKPIRVSIKSDEIKKAAEDSSTAPVVVHIEDDNTATEIENTASKTDSGTIEIEKPAADPENTSDPAIQSDYGQDDGSEKNTDSQESNNSKENNPPVAPTVENKDESTDRQQPADTKESVDTDKTAVTDESADIDKATDNLSENEENADRASTGDTVEFEADSFSIYAIVYTVDFHWEVDGKVYEISIPGGGFLSFEKLVEILGIAKTDKEAESGNNQRAKSESDAAEETENSDEMAENNEASESTEDIEPDKETENTDKIVSASDDSQINEISDELNKKDIFLLALKDVRVSEETKEFVAKVDHIEFSNPELLWVDKAEKECTVSELKENNNLEVQYSDELTEEQIDEINAQTVETGDWALISLQQFYTEETLTVTMTNGKTWTIRVTDAVAENPVRNPGTVNTVDTYADGVKMWLFNYDTDGNLDDSSNKIKFNGTDHTGKVGFNNNTLASDGINGYSGLKFLGWGSDSDYNITSNVDINNFTGLDESGQGKGNKIKALQGIVQNSLDENGYPVLNSQYSSTSLDYLFDPTANTNDRVVYGGENGNVTNLFRKENGYYKFDSNQHYAQFDGDHTFTVYDTTIPQTDKNGNKHNPTRAVGFFPFNSYNNMLGIWDTNQNQNGSHTLYLNPDRDTSKTDRAGVKDLDHHFGVMLEAKFVLPADGKDENGNPIRFDFSGDDDMWVFIDDELVLDIGGIHQPVSGTIDFQNGKAYVVGDHTVAGHSDNTGTNAVATAYGAGVTRNSTGDGNYYFYNDDSVGKKVQLGDGKVHTMKIFYIERGGCDSNCEITFNLPTVKTGNLDLKKVWGDVERQAEEVYYTITANYKEASDANKRDLAKFFSTMKEKELSQYGLTKDNIKQIDANNDGVLDNNDPYVFVVKGSDWELKLKQLRICQDSLQNGNLTHDQVPLTYTVLERYALVDGKIVDATDQYSQAIEKSGAPLPSTSDIILGENDVSLWQDTTGNNATFKVTNEPGMNVTVNKDWAQDCDPLSDTTITGVVKRYKLVDKGNTLTIQSVLEDTDNSGIDFSGVTYTIMKNGQQVGDPISFAEAQAGKNLELPDSGPYTVVENNVPGTPQGYSVVHNPQNQQHNVTLDPNGNTTVTFTSTYKQVNKPSNSTYLIRDYYYYNYQGGKDLNSGNIEFPVGARVTMKFKCRNGYWSSRDMKAEYNGERINITASAKDNNQNLEFTVGPFTVVENGRLVVDVNTNGNSNNDGFVSGSVNFTQVRSLHSNLRAMRMPLKAAPQKTDLTFSQELNETTLASLPAAPEGKHYVLDNWSKEVNLDAASDWTKTVAVEVGNNYGDYYYFLASVTEHNVTQDTQGTIATNNDGSIRFAHKHADSNLPFEIENKRAKGALKITKNVTYNNGAIGDIPEGKESLVDKEFKFTVTKDGTQIEGSPFSITITNGASQSLTIPDLEMGNYVITETDSKGLELTAYTGGISQDSTTKSVTVTVTARDNTAAQPTAQAFFTNNYSETDIIVKKVDQNKAAANPEDAERFIAGAKFSLLDGDERAVTGYKVINLKTNQEVVIEDNKFVVPLEGVKIIGLLNGSYVLKEREAPAGYIITNNTTAFTVADGKVTAGGNGLTFEIPNPPGAALPNTGGPGTNKIYLLGIMLSGIAGAGLVMRKRRRAA
jgi:fibro-slime domain-containing protein/LPXTG-motif cell wall-anchored protein